MKAYFLVFAFVVGTIPAAADELPQSRNAWRATEGNLAQPGSFHWTVEDGAEGVRRPAATGPQARNDAPARAALAQMRAETARIMNEAKRASGKVQRIRYDLHVKCVVEQLESEPDPLANVSMPWIWSSLREADEPDTATIEVCEVDYSQKVRSQAGEEPQMRDYAVSFPVE